MISPIKAMPNQWPKKLYIAKLVSIDVDDDGNEISTYETPVEYKFNYRSVSSEADIAEFGVRAKEMMRAVIPIKYAGEFKEFDVAYLDGAEPTNEGVNGANANYKLLPPRNGNSVIIIYFERLIGK